MKFTKQSLFQAQDKVSPKGSIYISYYNLMKQPWDRSNNEVDFQVLEAERR